METTEDYKYYLSRNEVSGEGIKTIEILKTKGNELKEEITYIRIPGGGFNITRTIHSEPHGFINSGYWKEISELEYELTSRGSLEVADTFDRFLSYFENPVGCIVFLKETYERIRVCQLLGIPLMDVRDEDIPGPLMDSIPWISNGQIMVTKECMTYLEALERIYLDCDPVVNKNDVWMRSGIRKLINKINENYPNLRES